MPVNIALNKPAYQSDPWIPGDNRIIASNAVDGRKSDLDWLAGQCAVSMSNTSTTTLWVNLTTIQSIHDITIYFMTGKEKWGKVEFNNMFLENRWSKF